MLPLVKSLMHHATQRVKGFYFKLKAFARALQKRRPVSRHWLRPYGDWSSGARSGLPVREVGVQEDKKTYRAPKRLSIKLQIIYKMEGLRQCHASVYTPKD
jgi:hypothetical protein